MKKLKVQLENKRSMITWLPVYVKLLTTERKYNNLTKIVLDFLSINLKIILDLQR